MLPQAIYAFARRETGQPHESGGSRRQPRRHRNTGSGAAVAVGWLPVQGVQQAGFCGASCARCVAGRFSRQHVWQVRGVLSHPIRSIDSYPIQDIPKGNNGKNPTLSPSIQPEPSGEAPTQVVQTLDPTQVNRTQSYPVKGRAPTDWSWYTLLRQRMPHHHGRAAGGGREVRISGVDITPCGLSVLVRALPVQNPTPTLTLGANLCLFASDGS